MSTTLNHLAQSRAQLAEASDLADAGSAAQARIHLLSAADHALIALAARSAVDVPPTPAPLDRQTVAVRLAELGAAPDDVAPVLRDLNDDSVDSMQDPALAARLDAGFGLVQALIDAYVAHPAGATAAAVPAYGGARSAMNARGAEAAARGLARLAAVARR